MSVPADRWSVLFLMTAEQLFALKGEAWAFLQVLLGTGSEIPPECSSIAAELGGDESREPPSWTASGQKHVFHQRSQAVLKIRRESFRVRAEEGE